MTKLYYNIYRGETMSKKRKKKINIQKIFVYIMLIAMIAMFVASIMFI